MKSEKFYYSSNLLIFDSFCLNATNYSKAFSEVYGTDFRREHIDQYKLDVTSILDEIASKRAELVDKTPFDDYESNLALQVIDERLKSIYGLILKNPEITRAYIENTVEPVLESIEDLSDDIKEIKSKIDLRIT